MKRSVGKFPKSKGKNGWSTIIPDRKVNGCVSGNHHFDWVVIGAGFSGLAAARRIANNSPESSIAVIEAGEIGDNASGRNSGFAIDLPHSTANGKAANEQARREIKANRYAISEIDHLVREHNIDCGWERTGRYHAAVTEKLSEKALKQYAKNLDSWGEEYERLDSKSLKDRIGTDYYCSAIYTPGTYLMNPAALITGLSECLPPNVKVFENSPVTFIKTSGGENVIEAGEAKVKFGKLILAVNAFSHLFGVFRERQLPILLYASLSEPLSEAQASSLGKDESWGVTPAHGFSGSTIRLTKDRRLLVRHGFEYSPKMKVSKHKKDKARSFHREILESRFAGLSSLKLENTWSGWLAISRNHAPAFGKIEENVFSASCCNGSGIVKNTAAGTLIADYAMKKKNEHLYDFLVQGKASYIPPRPFRDIGYGFKIMCEKWGGRKEA